MSYTIDANILFSGMLSKKEIYKKLFIENVIYTSEFALLEIKKYEELILEKQS